MQRIFVREQGAAGPSPVCPSGLCLSCVSGEAVSLAVLRSYTEVADLLKGKAPQV